MTLVFSIAPFFLSFFLSLEVVELQNTIRRCRLIWVARERSDRDAVDLWLGVSGGGLEGSGFCDGASSGHYPIDRVARWNGGSGCCSIFTSPLQSGSGLSSLELTFIIYSEPLVQVLLFFTPQHTNKIFIPKNLKRNY